MNIKTLPKENIISILLYVILLSVFTFSFTINTPYSNQNFIITIFILMIVIGIILIYYFNKNKQNLFKVAFIIILIFGLCSVFLTPIDDVSDEYEHLVRAEIVSGGEITANYINNSINNIHGFKSIEAINDLGSSSDDNLLNNNLWNTKINYTDYYSNCAFAQNPFYAYIAPAIGILIAELLNLSTIWILYLARIANLILYASIITIAIKKSPIFKFPLFVTSTVPLAIYQAGSASADCFFNAFAILAIAYFFVLYKSKTIKYKNLGIFYTSIILAGLLKEPYLALSLLIFLVPNSNFKDKKQNIISKIAILLIILIGVSWSSYATTELKYSWREYHFRKYHVNATEQAGFMLSNPSFDLKYFMSVLISIPKIFNKFFNFSTNEFSYTSQLLATSYFMFIIITSLIYPLKEKITLLSRLKIAIIDGIIYYGIFLVQYLTWIPVKSKDIIQGVSGRYFIPLLIFIPLIINISPKIKLDKEKIKPIIFAIMICFIAAMLMLTTCNKF